MSIRNNKKIALPLFIIGISLYVIFENYPQLIQGFPEQQRKTNDQSLIQAYENRQSDIQVSGSGVVVRMLPDDTEGSQHQKFIIKISSGKTILISHNIDLAPRINTLSIGDSVEFYGEYEWNNKGGVIHWTHHDPGGRHIDGWLKHNGATYQ